MSVLGEYEGQEGLPSKIPCASVLKPLYAFIASSAYPHIEDWHTDARAAIIHSDNDATDRLVEKIGGLQGLTDGLNRLMYQSDGLSAHKFNNEPRTWGQYHVNSSIINSLYRALVWSKVTTVTESINDMMYMVPSDQRFGLPTGHRVKAGWDLYTYQGQNYLTTLVVDLDANKDKAGAVQSGARIKALYKRDTDIWYRTLYHSGPTSVIPMHAKFKESELT